MPEADYSIVHFQEFRRYMAQVGDGEAGGLKPGGGGGTSGGGMEERVAKLEAHVEHVLQTVDRLDRGQEGLRTDVGALRVDVSAIKTRLEHVPTISKMWSAAIAIVVALAAVIALAVRFVPHST